MKRFSNKKIFSSILAICLILPAVLMLTACGKTNNGGNNNGGNGGNNNTTIAFADYFNGVKLIENMYTPENLSEGSIQYDFATSVIEQVDSLATELLLRFCGHFGLGLTVELAETYGIVIENDIIHETTAKHAIHYDKWDWDHVRDFENILTDLENPVLYIEVYFNAYPSVNKENYKDKLIFSLYNLLVGQTPSNLEESTLREIAKKFDHLGFFEEEVDSITNFVLKNIIGELNLSDDLAGYNSEYDRYGYYNYAEVVPQLVLDSVGRKINNVEVYPFVPYFQFSEKSIDDCLVGETPFRLSAGEIKSIVLNTKKTFDISGFSLIFEMPEINKNVKIKITGKYQYFNADTNSYEVIRASFGEMTVKPGAYNQTTNNNEFKVDFNKPTNPSDTDYTIGNEFFETHNLSALRMGAFTDNTPVESGTNYIVGKTGITDILGYKSNFELMDKEKGYNVEYVDNTPFLQLFFEVQGNNQNINLKFAFKDIAIIKAD